MKKINIKNFLLYCSVEKEEFDALREIIWRRNSSILRVTSLLAISMSAVFLVVNNLRGIGILLPYLVLLIGSVIILALLLLTRKKKSGKYLGLPLCYAQMLLVCVYATMLSTQSSNFAIPATSVIVFIALIPQSIDDRPVRMYAVMLLESAAYLLISYFQKSAQAFSLDIMNMATFLVVGMILYSVICTRNVRELFSNQRVERIQKNTVLALATVVEERDENTGGHIQRTEDYVSMLIDCMHKKERYAALTADYCRNIILAAPMHDIGKIKIPDKILNKPARLDKEEFEIMKKHSAYGAQILEATLKNTVEEDYYRIAYNIARYHHERYDGGGYPDGLRGEDIPLEARVMALADVYDALVSERVYKKAFTREEACAIIRDGAGTQFDPELTELFLECIE